MADKKTEDSEPIAVKLMIVDDEADITELIEANALAIGFQTQICHSGEEALKHLEKAEGEFDALFTDIRMDGIDGLELIHQVRRINGEMSVVIMSGSAEKDDVIAAIELGVANFLEKPVSTVAIKATLKNVYQYQVLRKEKEALLQKLVSITSF